MSKFLVINGLATIIPQRVYSNMDVVYDYVVVNNNDTSYLQIGDGIFYFTLNPHDAMWFYNLRPGEVFVKTPASTNIFSFTGTVHVDRYQEVSL